MPLDLGENGFNPVGHGFNKVDFGEKIKKGAGNNNGAKKTAQRTENTGDKV